MSETLKSFIFDYNISKAKEQRSLRVPLQQIQEPAVTRSVDLLSLGLLERPETVIVALDLLHLHVLIEIESELELALHNIILHLAGNDSILAGLELVPQIYLTSQLKF